MDSYAKYSWSLNGDYILMKSSKNHTVVASEATAGNYQCHIRSRIIGRGQSNISTLILSKYTFLYAVLNVCSWG